MKRKQQIEIDCNELQHKIEFNSNQIKSIIKISDIEDKQKQTEELEQLNLQLTTNLNSLLYKKKELEIEMKEILNSIESHKSELEMQYFYIERESHLIQDLENSDKADKEEKLQKSRLRLNTYSSEIEELTNSIKILQEKYEN